MICDAAVVESLFAERLRRIKTPRYYEKAERRFHESVSRPESGCWEWVRGCVPGGYGMFSLGRERSVAAHRFSWVIHHGAISGGLYVLHKCDNRKCVNPDHLFLGTAADNNADMIAKGRQNPTPPTNPTRGERVYGAKLKEADVPVIVSARACGDSVSSIARRFGVSRCAIQRILDGSGWKHVKRTA